MMKQALAFFPYKDLPMVGLFIFVTLFVGIVFWVNRKGSDQVYSRIENLPLDEEKGTLS